MFWAKSGGKRRTACENEFLAKLFELFTAWKIPNRHRRFCGTATEPQKSDQNVINIRFHAKEGVIPKKLGNDTKKSFQFDILFTAFRSSERGSFNSMTESSLPLSSLWNPNYTIIRSDAILSSFDGPYCVSFVNDRKVHRQKGVRLWRWDMHWHIP